MRLEDFEQQFQRVFGKSPAPAPAASSSESTPLGGLDGEKEGPPIE